MPDDPADSAPDSTPPIDPIRRAQTGLAGETTGTNLDPTVITPRSDGGSLLPGAAPLRAVIGGFEILSKLGQGGMGAVYRARQISLEREVALKILPSTLEADADFVNRFQREARVAASLSHANLVKVYAAGEADGSHFIAMELIEGETLGDWLKRGALQPLEALRICGDVARALAHGWQRAQLVHRDIKPGNIFLSTHGDVKVGDLGLAKTLGGDTTGLTQTGTAMGTPHYISPEQARGERDIDFRADIYSLGCTLYQMLTGRTPYEGREPMVVMNQHINAPPPAILKALPHCPIPLARLVGKMLKKAKRERHHSYEELIAQIDSVRVIFDPSLTYTPPPPGAEPVATLLQTPAPRLPGGKTSPSAKPRTTLYASVGAGVVILGVVASLLWPKQEKLSKAELALLEREKAGLTPAPAEPSAAGTPAPVQPAVVPVWRDAFVEAGPIRRMIEKLTPSAEGYDLPTKSNWNIFETPLIAAAVRWRGLVSELWPGLSIRQAAEAHRVGIAAQTGTTFLSSFQSDGRREVGEVVPLTPGTVERPNELLLLRVGGRVLLLVDGVVRLDAADRSSGPVTLGLIVDSNQSGRTKALHFADLTGLTAADALAFCQGKGPAAAPATAAAAPILNFGGHRYQLVPPSVVTWAEARARAEAAGGHLATVNSSEEDEWLKQTFGEQVRVGGTGFIHLGGRLETGQWKWITGEPFTDTGWLPGQPNGSGSTLQYFWYQERLGWDDRASTNVAPTGYIVEWDTPASATASSGWEPLVSAEEWRHPSPGKREFKDGLLHVRETGLSNSPASADGAVRAVVHIRDGTGRPYVQARWVKGTGTYILALESDRKTIRLQFASPGAPSGLLGRYELPQPLQVRDNVTMELRAVGHRLTGLVNGRAVIEAQDDRLKASGTWGFFADDGWFESAEYQSFPPAPAP